MVRVLNDGGSSVNAKLLVDLHQEGAQFPSGTARLGLPPSFVTFVRGTCAGRPSGDTGPCEMFMLQDTDPSCRDRESHEHDVQAVGHIAIKHTATRPANWNRH